MRRSKGDRGTNLFYTHASLHIVEHGKRVTAFSMPVYQLDDLTTVVEKLVNAARARGIKILLLLVDRGFFSVDAMNKLKEMRVRYLMPAVKNGRIKRAIEGYHDGLISSVVKSTMENSEKKQASFSLLTYRKPDAKENDPIHKQYLVFATNMPRDEAMTAFEKMPDEYRKRWGIETGFRVQDNVQAKTTSTDYTVRITYQMMAIMFYNVCVLANQMLADQSGVEFVDPLIKLSILTKYFRLWIETPGDTPPR